VSVSVSVSVCVHVRVCMCACHTTSKDSGMMQAAAEVVFLKSPVYSHFTQ